MHLMNGCYEVTEIDTQQGAKTPEAVLPSVTIHGIKCFPGDQLFFKNDKLNIARIKGPHNIAGNELLPGKSHINVRFDAQGHINQISFSEPLQANGILFRPSYLTFYSDGQMYSGALEQEEEFDGITAAVKGLIFLHANGRLKFANIAKPVCLQGFNLLGGGHIIMFSNGNLDTGALNGEHTIATKFDGILKIKGWLSLHENGQPHVVTLAADYAGCRAGSTIHFNEAGHMGSGSGLRCNMRYQIGTSVITDALNWPHCQAAE